MSVRETVGGALVQFGGWLAGGSASEPSEPSDEEWQGVITPLERAMAKLGESGAAARKAATAHPKGTVADDLQLVAEETLDLLMQLEALKLRVEHEPALAAAGSDGASG